MSPDALPDLDVEFLRRREREELAGASTATNSGTRLAHLALARAYARKINQSGRTARGK